MVNDAVTDRNSASHKKIHESNGISSNTNAKDRGRNSRRRRKKRRTEDFSSDDESGSSSESSDSDNKDDNEIKEEDTNLTEESTKTVQVRKHITSNVSLGKVIEEEEFNPDLKVANICKIDNVLARKLQLLNSQSNRKVEISDISIADVKDQEKLLKEFILNHVIRDNLENRELREKLIEELAELNNGNSGSGPAKIINKKDEEEKGFEEDKNKKEKCRLLDEFISLMMKDYDDDLDTLRKASDLSSFSLSILATTLKESGSVFDYESLKAILQ